MCKLVFHVSFLTFASSVLTYDIREPLNAIMPGTFNKSGGIYPPLCNCQVDAEEATEEQYPWIARVVHSRSAEKPHVCTAVCIDEAIFITAARCLYTLKVKFTTVIYKSKQIQARAFVFPSEPTNLMFDDIGFIVVNTKPKSMQWTIIELYNVPNRTDESFDWYLILDKAHARENIKYKAVGYAAKRGYHRLKLREIKFSLSELDVIASIDLCFDFVCQRYIDKAYQVPCYHSCTFEEYKNDNTKCKNFHGVEGGALFDTISNKLIGIATWGIEDPNSVMPVGFATLNSDNFFRDYTCAKRIREDNGLHVTKDYYQNLCDEN